MQRKLRRRWQRLAKKILPPIAAGCLIISGHNSAFANPAGGTVASGAAAISTSGSTTIINQTTNKAIINWQSFSIGSGETVNFVQPSSTSVALNRVIGSDASSIYGALNANGKVYLINPNGVLFSSAAQVNVGGLVTSTLDIADSDFLRDNYSFSGSGTGSVINKGNITAQNEAVFIGPKVANEGVVAAKVVGLAAGNKVSLDFNGDQLLNVAVDTGAAGGSVVSSGTITANGGLVVMSAGTVDALLSTVVNNSGLIKAETVTKSGGVIRLEGTTATNSGILNASGKETGTSGGTVKVLGDTVTLSAGSIIDVSGSAAGGNVETSGRAVQIADSAVVTTLANSGKTGTWLIDPTDYTIAASGGDITGASLSTKLATANIEIKSSDGKSGTSGNINVNDAVSWSADTTLTLTASNDINVNKTITASGASTGLTLNAGGNININNAVTLSGASAALAMNYGGYNGTTVTTATSGTNYNILTKASTSGTTTDAYGNVVAVSDTSGGVYGSITLSGSNAGLTINGNTYTLIHSLSQLDLLDGFNAVTGCYYNSATGLYDIACYNASTMRYYDPTTKTYQDRSLTVNSISGYYALAGDLDAAGTTYASSLISNFNGTLAGLGHTVSNLTINTSTEIYTGLIGTLGAYGTSTLAAMRDIGVVDTSINNSYYRRGYAGSAGGLVGYSYGNIIQGYTTGTVICQNGVSGGLIGYSQGIASSMLSVVDCYSTAKVFAGGGLIGQAKYTNIYNSHASGAVSGVSNIGGLLGSAYNVSVYNSYATGSVTGGVDVNGKAYLISDTVMATNIGGLIGYVNGDKVTSSYVKNSFATGNVTGGTYLGGLIGYIYYPGAYYIDNCYATGNVTGSMTSYTGDFSADFAGIGGLVGAFKGNDAYPLTITSSYATGNVSCADLYGSYVGGLIGSIVSKAYVSNSYATGNITGGSNSSAWGIGGFVGYSGSTKTTIDNCYAAGDVYGSRSVGGFAGSNSSVITNSYSTGNVTGTAGNLSGVGGFVGSNDGSISGSYATGDVTGASGSAAGGFAGINTGSISSGYATGDVFDPNGYAGGFAGLNWGTGTITNVYFNADNGSSAVNDYIPSGLTAGKVNEEKGLSSSQFKDIPYYLNGTIGQVLATRAAAMQTAGAQHDVATQAPMQAGFTTQESQSKGDSLQSLDDWLNPSKLPKAPATVQSIQAAPKKSANYSAHVKSVEINGVEYQLEDDDAKDNKSDKKK